MENELMRRLSKLMGGRPVRRTAASDVPGDYDGRERTLEIFNAEPREQRSLLRELRPLRTELEQALGGPIVIIFHTPEESARLYADFILQALQGEAQADAAAVEFTALLEEEALAIDCAVDKGGTALPRHAA